jgi:3-hydroxyacyl-[acyl-carrier-protein] dehydratase
MRFSLIDRIVELEPGRRIVAIKALSSAEEYLQDHFPKFPVMPGVMMLESLHQASAWLIRKSEEFAHSIVLLKEAKNVKYSDFVEPGQVLTVTADLMKEEGPLVTLKAQGDVNGRTAVTARLVLERSNLGDSDPARADLDPYVRRRQQEQFQLLYHPEPAANRET